MERERMTGITEMLASDCEAVLKSALNILRENDLSIDKEAGRRIGELIKAAPPYIRLFAIELAGLRGLGEHSLKLISIATDRRSPMHHREKAVWALGRIRDSEAVPHLLAIMIEPYDALALYTRDALARIGEPVISPLLNFLRNPELGMRQRLHLFELLVELSADSELKKEQLLQFMKKCSLEERLIYLKNLRDIRATEYVRLIEEKLDRTELTRTYSLDRILEHFTSNRDRIELMINKLAAIDEPLALKLLVALKKLETGDMDSLSRLCSSVMESHQLGMIASLLGMLDTKQVLPILVNMLHSADRRVRANAVESIAGLPDMDEETVLGLLEPMLSDPDNRVRANTARVLWQIGGLQMLEVLRRMALTGEKWARASAAFALGEIGVFQVVDILLEILKTPDIDIRRNAIRSLSRTKDPEIVGPLAAIAFDTDEDYHLRKLAIEGVAQAGTPEAAEVLLALTKQFREDPAIHQAAFEKYREITS